MKYNNLKFFKVNLSLLVLCIICCIRFSSFAQNDKSERSLFTENLKFSIGGSLFGGVGSEQHDLFETSDDETATLSPGGGFGLDLTFGYLISPKFEIDINAAFQSSSLSKSLENADASFKRYYVNSSLKFIIPAKKNDRAWKFGGGIGYYIPQNLFIEWKDISNIVDGDIEIQYDPSIGFHLVSEYEMFFYNKNWSFLINIMYYFTSYNYTSASSTNITIIDMGDFEKINGNTFNFGITLKKYL